MTDIASTFLFSDSKIIPKNQEKMEPCTEIISRESIQDYYEDKIIKRDSCSDVAYLKEILQNKIISYLSDVIVSEGSRLNETFSKILESSANDISNWDANDAAHVFLILEKLTNCIISAPWKKEFDILKLYNGFFNLQINPFLKNVKEIFFLIGYEEISSNILAMKKPVCYNQLTKIACECYVASVECLQLIQIAEKLQGSYMKDIYNARTSCSGGVIKCVKQLLDRIENPDKDKKELLIENIDNDAQNISQNYLTNELCETLNDRNLIVENKNETENNSQPSSPIVNGLPEEKNESLICIEENLYKVYDDPRVQTNCTDIVNSSEIVYDSEYSAFNTDSVGDITPVIAFTPRYSNNVNDEDSKNYSQSEPDLSHTCRKNSNTLRRGGSADIESKDRKSKSREKSPTINRKGKSNSQDCLATILKPKNFKSSHRKHSSFDSKYIKKSESGEIKSSHISSPKKSESGEIKTSYILSTPKKESPISDILHIAVDCPATEEFIKVPLDDKLSDIEKETDDSLQLDSDEVIEECKKIIDGAFLEKFPDKFYCSMDLSHKKNVDFPSPIEESPPSYDFDTSDEKSSRKSQLLDEGDFWETKSGENFSYQPSNNFYDSLNDISDGIDNSLNDISYQKPVIDVKLSQSKNSNQIKYPLNTLSKPLQSKTILDSGSSSDEEGIDVMTIKEMPLLPIPSRLSMTDSTFKLAANLMPLQSSQHINCDTSHNSDSNGSSCENSFIANSNERIKTDTIVRKKGQNDNVRDDQLYSILLAKDYRSNSYYGDAPATFSTFGKDHYKAFNIQPIITSNFSEKIPSSNLHVDDQNCEKVPKVAPPRLKARKKSLSATSNSLKPTAPNSELTKLVIPSHTNMTKHDNKQNTLPHVKSFPKSWQCIHCTYYNTKTDYICEMCHKSKIPLVDKKAEEIGTVCYKCTYVSQRGHILCQMCQNPLSALHEKY